MTIAVTTWIAAGAIAGALALAGVQTMRLSSERAAHATTRASYADERVEAIRLTAKAETEQRAIYESRIGAKDEIIAQAKKVAEDRAVALAGSRRTADSLRDDLAAYLARADKAGGHPGAGPGSPAAAAPARMLGELFAEADSFAGVMEAAFAGARNAGLICEQSYDSLTTR